MDLILLLTQILIGGLIGIYFLAIFKKYKLKVSFNNQSLEKEIRLENDILARIKYCINITKKIDPVWSLQFILPNFNVTKDYIDNYILERIPYEFNENWAIENFVFKTYKEHKQLSLNTLVSSCGIRHLMTNKPSGGASLVDTKRGILYTKLNENKVEIKEFDLYKDTENHPEDTESHPVKVGFIMSKKEFLKLQNTLKLSYIIFLSFGTLYHLFGAYVRKLEEVINEKK